MPKPLVYLLPSFFWVIVIGFLCFTPGDQLPEFEIFSYDKIGHLGLFALMFFSLAWGLSKQGRLSFSGRYVVQITWPFCLAYSLLIEIAQTYWISNRNGDWADFLADLIGCGIGYFFYRFWISSHTVTKTN